MDIELLEQIHKNTRSKETFNSDSSIMINIGKEIINRNHSASDTKRPATDQRPSRS